MIRTLGAKPQQEDLLFALAAEEEHLWLLDLPMVLSLSNFLLCEILGLGGGFLSLTLAFTLLFLHILDPDGDLARALDNFSQRNSIKNNRRLLESFNGIGRDLPDLWGEEDTLRQS